MSDSDLDIPDFLKLTKEEREAGWREHPPQRYRARFAEPVKKPTDPGTLELLREMKREEARAARQKKAQKKARAKQRREFLRAIRGKA